MSWKPWIISGGSCMIGKVHKKLDLVGHTKLQCLVDFARELRLVETETEAQWWVLHMYTFMASLLPHLELSLSCIEERSILEKDIQRKRRIGFCGVYLISTITHCISSFES